MVEVAERTCANCACSHVMKHPQLVNQQQMVCRRNGLMLATMNVVTPEGMKPQQGLMYAITQADAVCYDGWRPMGTPPGENAADSRCDFGGNYGRCTLERGHDGSHIVKK